MKLIHKVAAVVIEDDKFLMVRKNGKDIWTSLGGHIEEGETEEEALLREIEEELNCKGYILRKLGDFEARAAHDDAIVRLSTYLVKLEGNPKINDPELAEFRFLPENYASQGIKLPESIVDGVLPYCIKEGLLAWQYRSS